MSLNRNIQAGDVNPRSAAPLPLSPHHVVISFVFPSLNPFKFKFPSVSRLGPQLLANLFPLLHHAASPAQLNMPFYYYIIRFSCPVPFLFEFAFFFFFWHSYSGQCCHIHLICITRKMLTRYLHSMCVLMPGVYVPFHQDAHVPLWEVLLGQQSSQLYL